MNSGKPPALQPPRVPTMDQLTALTFAARTGSMGAAADLLGLSQQAISARVSAAEKLIGFLVLERRTTGVRPTGKGQLVLVWAEDVLAAAHKLEEGYRGLQQGNNKLTVAASNTISEALLPRWATELRTAHPDTSLDVVLGNSSMVLQSLLSGHADLGFVETPSIPRGLRSTVIGRDELVVVTTPDHPWALRGAPISHDVLAETPLVLREPGSGSRAFFAFALPNHASPFRELPSSAAVRDAIRTTGVPGVLSTLTVSGDIEHGDLVRIPVTGVSMVRTLRATWHAKQPPRGKVKELMDIALGVPLRA